MAHKPAAWLINVAKLMSSFPPLANSGQILATTVSGVSPKDSNACKVVSADTALPTDQTFTSVSACQASCLAMSLCPAHRSTTFFPSRTTDTQAPISPRSVKLSENACLTRLNRVSQLPWMMISDMHRSLRFGLVDHIRACTASG